MDELSFGQYEFIFNVFSFSLATMGAATLFFWFGRQQVSAAYKTAMTITGLVTFIAAYHYLRIFQSWEASYVTIDGVFQRSGVAFNDAYRYVDWLLTVPLLMIELILVMNLTRSQAISKGARLGVLAALMIILGYPGEIADSNGERLIWGVVATLPFLWILYELFVGLRGSIASQPPDVRGLVSTAVWVTVVSWTFYPVVYFIGLADLGAGTSEVAIQTGYTIADITSKVGFGLLIYTIAVRKSGYDHGVPASAQPAD